MRSNERDERAGGRGVPILRRVVSILKIGCTAALALFLFFAMGGGRAFYGEILPRRYSTRIAAFLPALSSALDAYLADHDEFPASRPLGDFAPEPELMSGTGAARLEGIDPGRAGGPAGLTTPVAYLETLPLDPFTGRRTHIPFLTMRRATWPLAYHRAEVLDAETGVRTFGWMLWSPGPDGRYDILDPEAFFDPSESDPRPELIEKTYDPTNGSFSRGDVFRTRRASSAHEE